MSDPRKTLKIHTCEVCYEPIHCRADCDSGGRRIVCAVCAVRS